MIHEHEYLAVKEQHPIINQHLFTAGQCCFRYALLFHAFDKFRDSAMRCLEYKEPAPGTSCEETVAERGWKFVFPINQ